MVKLIRVKLGKWALGKKELQNISILDLMRNWAACLFGPDKRERKSISRYPPPSNSNMDGSSKGKQGMVGIGDVLLDDKGVI